MVFNPNAAVMPATWPQTPAANLADAFAPKRAGKKTSHVIFVLDDSSSMQSCRDATIEGFNEFLDGQKRSARQTGIETFVSLYKFDGMSVECVYGRKPVDKAEHINRHAYDPRGSTNLLDAIGGVMMTINDQLKEVKKSERDSIIICVLTDGQENTSRTFDNSTVKAMVEKAEGKNWGFMFMGANIDAFAAGGSLGFTAQNTIQFTTNNVRSTMLHASRMSSDMKAMYASGMNTTLAYAASTFTDEERDDAVKASGDN